MELLCMDDVDKFLDKFQDPTQESVRILKILNIEDTDINVYFVHRLLMKTYRLGKEHAYATSLETIRR